MIAVLSAVGCCVDSIIGTVVDIIDTAVGIAVVTWGVVGILFVS